MILRGLVALVLGTALLWLGGLLLFVAQVEAMDEPRLSADLAPVDAIVVLTGGSERVATGVGLLEAGKGQKLFISGVHPASTLDLLLGNKPVPKELRDCCIMLGHEAASTMGNADETLTWMTLENYHSMRLVTANYHMPRSLLIFHTALPDISIVPHPVAPDSVKLDDWWMRPGTASLLMTEYTKYLFALLRLQWGTGDVTL